jgi:hypothetical protein
MWKANRIGSTVEVCNSTTGEVVATVGDEKDPRLLKRISDATLIAQAPAMLEALLDVQELVKREFLDTTHPLAEIVTTKINTIIQNSFTKRNNELHQDRDFRPRACDNRVSEFIRSKQNFETRVDASEGVFGEVRDRMAIPFDT